jgi:hypothetical protein
MLALHILGPAAALISILLGVENSWQRTTLAQQGTIISRKEDQIRELGLFIDKEKELVAQNEELIRGLRAELNDLKQRIDDSGLSTAMKPADPPKVFRVVDRDRIEVSGSYNPKFIQEVRVRWGVKADDEFVSVHKGGPEPNPQGRRTEFSVRSPELPLKGTPMVATLEFVPYPEVQRLFPQFFLPDKLQYSRNFFLAQDGIQVDPNLVEIVSPQNGARVAQIEQVDGRLDTAKTREGWPVVLVRVDNLNEWWVQPVDEIQNGQFSSSTNFGNATPPPPGTKFRIVVVVAKSKSEAKRRFPAGARIGALPPDLPKSAYVTVERGD